jgi:RhoGAP domain
MPRGYSFQGPGVHLAAVEAALRGGGRGSLGVPTARRDPRNRPRSALGSMSGAGDVNPLSQSHGSSGLEASISASLQGRAPPRKGSRVSMYAGVAGGLPNGLPSGLPSAASGGGGNPLFNSGSPPSSSSTLPPQHMRRMSPPSAAISPPPVGAGATLPPQHMRRMSPPTASSSSAAATSDAARDRSETESMREVRELAAQEQPSTETVDNASVIGKKKKTAALLGAWLKTKRPTADDLQSKGFISTAGSVTSSARVKSKNKSGVIGMPLDEMLRCLPDRPIPIIVDQCVTYIRKRGMKLSGIFRVSPDQAELKRLRKSYKSPTDVVDLAKKVTTAHSVAGLLKLWLQELPESLVPFNLYEPFIELFSDESAQVDKDVRIDRCNAMLATVPQHRRVIVDFLFDFLHELSKSAKHNKMTPNNLGIVFGPNLIRPREHTQTTMMNRTNVAVVEFLLENYKKIFTKR